MAVVRRCPRCARWHPVVQPCRRPDVPDLSAWVAGTLEEQFRADEAEAAAILRLRLSSG